MISFLSDLSLSTLELVITVIATSITLCGAFFGALWYLGLDRKTQSYDEDIRSEIEEDPAFSGIRQAARPKLHPTSATRTSKSFTWAKKKAGRTSDRPQKVVSLNGDSLPDRKIEMLRERTKEISGKNLLSKDLVASIRNFYAFKLALSRDDIDSEVAEHFKSRLELYDNSQKVVDLATHEHYQDICLLETSDVNSEYDALNDIFLELVQASESHCRSSSSGVTELHEEIENCKGYLMLSFYSLWAKYMKGVVVDETLGSGDCIPLLRSDLREEDNWGYWVLSEGACDEDEFEKVQHMCWKVSRAIDEHWEAESYSKLHPGDDNIVDIEPVERPFLLVTRDESEIRGGGPSAVG